MLLSGLYNMCIPILYNTHLQDIIYITHFYINERHLHEYLYLSKLFMIINVVKPLKYNTHLGIGIYVKCAYILHFTLPIGTHMPGNLKGYSVFSMC